MRPQSIKHIISPVLVLCFLVFTQAEANTNSTNPTAGFDDTVVIERLENMGNAVVDPKWDRTVKGYLMGYMVRHRAKAERILGRSSMYFPLYEKYLKAHGVPEELKYLSVVESALYSKATSRVGAMGLWQFMPATGKEYGLKINDYVDERCDPTKSTLAAIRYLKKYEAKYGSWPLALAAYNGGSGRVSRAIKRGRSRNFWRIRRYLPRETRSYVPAYIAASYLFQHYKDHGLTPQYPHLDLQITETIMVTSYFSFYKLSQITDLPLSLIEELNPAYKKGFIPSNPKGNYITLPARVMPAFRDFINAQRPDYNEAPIILSEPSYFFDPLQQQDQFYSTSKYLVQGTETVEEIAAALEVSTYHLQVWNNLTDSTVLIKNQELTVFLPKEIKRLRPLPKFEPIVDLQWTNTPRIHYEAPNNDHLAQERNLFIRGKYLMYLVVQEESLQEIANKFDSRKIKELVKLNPFKPDDTVPVGYRIKMKRL